MRYIHFYIFIYIFFANNVYFVKNKFFQKKKIFFQLSVATNEQPYAICYLLPGNKKTFSK